MPSASFLTRNRHVTSRWDGPSLVRSLPGNIKAVVPQPGPLNLVDKRRRGDTMALTMDPCLATALAGRRPLSLPPQIGKLESREVGVLSVPTGRLVACDPLTSLSPVAFE